MLAACAAQQAATVGHAFGVDMRCLGAYRQPEGFAHCDSCRALSIKHSMTIFSPGK